MSVDGVDLRKFSNSRKSGMEPQDDPYYGRKPINSMYEDEHELTPSYTPSSETETPQY